jgi:quercetin dioxygenase-like cupin family protein
MFLRTLAVSTLVAAGLGLAAPAFAGDCPAGQMRADATKPVTHAPKAVTDTVLSQIDLAGEKLALKGHLMRVRKLEIQPGGIVPWHSHAERSNCAVPILHKAGEVAKETHATAHWWKNDGKVPVVLLSFDIQHDPNDKNM